MTVAKKPLGITDVVLRDAHQSILATRVRLEDMLPIAAKLDQVGAALDEVGGGAVAQGVRGRFGGDTDGLAEFLEHSLSFPGRQVSVILPRKEWRRRSGGKATLAIESQQLCHAFLGRVVERDHPGLSSLRQEGGQMELITWNIVVGDVGDQQSAEFADAQAGVVQEQDQKVVATPERASEVDSLQQG